MKKKNELLIKSAVKLSQKQLDALKGGRKDYTGDGGISDSQAEID